MESFVHEILSHFDLGEKVNLKQGERGDPKK